MSQKHENFVNDFKTEYDESIRGKKPYESESERKQLEIIQKQQAELSEMSKAMKSVRQYAREVKQRFNDTTGKSRGCFG